MKLFSIFVLLLTLQLSPLSYAQFISIGSGYFFDHYSPKGDRSNYHPQMETYYWAFLGGSISYNYTRKDDSAFKNISIYGNFYPLMYGFDLRNYESEDIYYISQDLVAPEFGIVSYYSPINSEKHEVSFGLGLSTRFVILPITGSVLNYESPHTSFKSIHIQKNRIALSIPVEIKYSFSFHSSIGVFVSLKRTFGLYSWIKNEITFDDLNKNTELGNAFLVNRGSRSLIEFGVNYKLRKNSKG